MAASPFSPTISGKKNEKAMAIIEKVKATAISAMFSLLEFLNASSKLLFPRLIPIRFFEAALMAGKTVHIMFETA